MTHLANDEGVSAKEVMLAARHSSVSANAAYQQSTSHSESNRYKALGYQPTKTPHTSTPNKRMKITPIPTTSTQSTMDEVTENIQKLENEIKIERTRSELHEKFHRLNKKVINLTDTMKLQRRHILHLREKDALNQEKIRKLNKLVETMKEEIRTYTINDVKNIFDDDDWVMDIDTSTTPTTTTPASNNTTTIHHCSSTTNTKPQRASLHVSYNTGFNPSTQRHQTNNFQDSTYYRVKNPYTKKKW